MESLASHGLVVDGGGEKNGILGRVVGMLGIEGTVVGMVGNGVAGNGGSVTLGILGMVGSVGFGRDGIWVLGKGGNVGFGKLVGIVGRVGKEVAGNGASTAVGRVGVAGNGGSVALGRVGMVGSVGIGREPATCNSWRAATLVSTLESDNTTIKARTGERKSIMFSLNTVLQLLMKKSSQSQKMFPTVDWAGFELKRAKLSEKDMVEAPSVQHDSLQNEDEADWGVGVGELEGAVVVDEGVAVGVGDGDVLEEGEVHGAVGDGEGRELDGVNGDLGVFRFEEEEVNDDDSGRQEEQEDRGHYARGKVGCTAVTVVHKATDTSRHFGKGGREGVRYLLWEGRCLIGLESKPVVGGGGDAELGELVRVALEGKPAVGGADLVGGAVAAKPQHLVLALLHCKMKMKPTGAPE
ncbi:hypothetical protein RJ639_009044 [Escallonia herrerae]|uniref:Uncharacterized protein n=1 Tax=Escallonia herrerae TaxID=1293975 RepID=A0AA88VQ36_9ASTE|nr:hypothetical protein RJ639_009044 [Escallonia herrerae]